MKSEIQKAAFDYTTIRPSDRALIQQKTTEIKDRMGRAAQNIVEIGTRLIEVKAAMPHGLFTAWLEDEFGWTDRTARSMMTVADRFKTENFSDLKIAPSALYMLASPSTEPEIRDAIVDRAKSGDKIERKDVIAAKARRVEATVPPTPTPNPDDIEPDEDDTPEPLPEPPRKALSKDEEFRLAHNAAIEAAIAHMQADIRSMASAFGYERQNGMHILTNPESKRCSSWSATIGLVQSTIKQLKVNLIVESPANPGVFVSASTAEQEERRLQKSA